MNMKSTTLKLVLMSLCVLNYQWLFGGVEATLTEYGMATGVITGIWLGREWKETHYKDNANRS